MKRILPAGALLATAADHGIDAFIFDWYFCNDGPFLIGWGAGDCATAPSHTTGRAVFRIRRLNAASLVIGKQGLMASKTRGARTLNNLLRQPIKPAATKPETRVLRSPMIHTEL